MNRFIVAFGLAMFVCGIFVLYGLFPNTFIEYAAFVSIFFGIVLFNYNMTRFYDYVISRFQRYRLNKEQDRLKQTLFEQEAAFSYHEAVPADFNQTKARLAEVKALLDKTK